MSPNHADQLQTKVYSALKTVIDPELGVDIVSLGLIYDVQIGNVQEEGGNKRLVHILMTLTTPGCPLAHVFDQMLRDSLREIDEIDPQKDVDIELTFDPPWIPEMMSEEARAELGFDT
jgi:metal-sulfur cluster biosynthetic enzyme